MGKGIALMFRETFPVNAEAYEKAAEAGIAERSVKVSLGMIHSYALLRGRFVNIFCLTAN